MRDKLIFQISVETGMRIGEILGLRLGDFDPHNNWLSVIKRDNIKNQAKAKRKKEMYRYMKLFLNKYKYTKKMNEENQIFIIVNIYF